MVVRNPGRFLAPVALVAVIVALVVLISSVLGNHRAVAPPPRVQQPAVFRRSPTATTSFYVIKAGDSLSTISAKTGVPLSQLESLNPSIDPNALQTGQRIRLRP